MKPDRPDFREAMAMIASRVSALPSETVRICDAVGRVTAEPVEARRFHPWTDLSAMDGYIISARDCAGSILRLLSVEETLFAGGPTAPLAEGMTRAIMTGAAIPAGGASVLIKEQAECRDGILRLAENLPEGMNIRRKGEDAVLGEIILEAGRVLSASMLGALIAYGVEKTLVRRQPNIAVIPTGDELRSNGGIPDINGPMITAHLRAMGANVTLCTPVGDRRDMITDAINRALAVADLVITTGGASAGERDHLPDVVRDLGAATHFHGVRIRPGKPVLFATAPNGRPLFCLPGNPVAALVAYRFFVTHALRRMLVMTPEMGRSVLATSVPANDATNISRVRVLNGAIDAPVEKLPGDRPHMMRSLLVADHWMVQEPRELKAMLYPLTDRLDCH